MHGLNEGHIAPNTDIEFQLKTYQTFITMKIQDKSLQLILEETITLLTKIKHVKQIALKQYFTTGPRQWNGYVKHAPLLGGISLKQRPTVRGPGRYLRTRAPCQYKDGLFGYWSYLLKTRQSHRLICKMGDPYTGKTTSLYWDSSKGERPLEWRGPRE